MWEIISIILNLIFWIAVWSNVSAVRKSLASIEESSALIAQNMAPRGPSPAPQAENRVHAPATPVASIKSRTIFLLLIGSLIVIGLLLYTSTHYASGISSARMTHIQIGAKVRPNIGSPAEVCTIAPGDRFTPAGDVEVGRWLAVEVKSGPNRGCIGVVFP